MNFYKHHLGDYDGATAHLSWAEDMAYTRLLRAYYRREAPIPTEMSIACRLVRATRPAEKAAVQSVLAEFFERREDGWHNKRADEEIGAYQHQAATNRRIARQRKQNEPLNEPPNESSHESCNEPSNDSQQTRTPNHKPEPDTRIKAARLDDNYQPLDSQNAPIQAKAENPEQPQDQPPDRVTPTAAGQWAGELRRRGVSITSQHPTLRAWIEQNFTLPWALEALAIARQHKPEGPIAANYLDKIIRDPPNKKSNHGAWWTSENATIAKGRELDLQARPGETMDGFRDRIKDAIGKARQTA